MCISPDGRAWLHGTVNGGSWFGDVKYQNQYSTPIPAVILAVNSNPIRFTDRSGRVSRRQ